MECAGLAGFRAEAAGRSANTRVWSVAAARLERATRTKAERRQKRGRCAGLRGEAQRAEPAKCRPLRAAHPRPAGGGRGGGERQPVAARPQIPLASQNARAAAGRPRAAARTTQAVQSFSARRGKGARCARDPRTSAEARPASRQPARAPRPHTRPRPRTPDNTTGHDAEAASPTRGAASAGRAKEGAQPPPSPPIGGNSGGRARQGRQGSEGATEGAKPRREVRGAQPERRRAERSESEKERRRARDAPRSAAPADAPRSAMRERA